MYDRAETAPALDRLWSAFRARIATAPDCLTRLGDPHDHWRDPSLLLSQTCGMPYRLGLHAHVALVASPDHGLPGLQPGHYHSVIVARAEDPRRNWPDFDGATLAFNATDSQSGWAAPLNHAQTTGVTLHPGLQSGAHINSARAVAEGRADLAALDAVSWEMMTRWDGFARALRPVTQTPPTPALPFITAATRDARDIRRALAAAIAALGAQDRHTLCLAGLVDIPAQAYLAVANPADPRRK